MPRHIPDALYSDVYALASEIVQPLSDPLDRVDESVSRIAYFKLEALYKKREDANEPDPFLTETLADFTQDVAKAIRLYRLSIAQSVTFPGEILQTKHVGLVRRLLEVNDRVEARAHLVMARAEALVHGDTSILEELDELSTQLLE